MLRTEATCNQSIVAINPLRHDEFLPEFLFLQLKSLYQEIRNITGDNQRSGLNMSIIKSIRVSIPPIETQKEIVAEIEKERALVESNKELVKMYEQKIQDKLAEVWEG